MRKKTTLIILLCIILSAGLITFLSNQSPPPPNKVIRIAGDNNFPPFEYLTNSGVYTGFNVDVLNAISIESGVKFEFHPMPWNEAIKALHAGKVDAIQGMKYSAERDRIYDFSDSYFTSTQAIFVHKENVHIRSLADLAEHKVVIQKGDIAIDLFAHNRQIQFIQVASQQEAIQLLADKKADAFVGNRITGQYFIQKSKQQQNIKIIGDPLYPENYGFVVLPKNKALLPFINEGIQTIKQNQTYHKIEQKWFGEYLEKSSYDFAKLTFFIQIGLFVTSVVILIILWWNRMLKKEVGKRTNEIAMINEQLEEKMNLLEDNIFFQQQLLDSAYSFYITLNQRGEVQMLNRRAERFLSVADSIISQPYEQTRIVEFIPPNQIQASLLQNKVYLEQETTWQQKIISYSVYPITTRSGENVGVVLNFSDLTQQRRLERKVAESNRLRALGQLMLGIAHEIRNPLTSILTYTQLLPKKMDNREFRQFFSEQVTSEIIRLNRLIDDLLNYAKPKKSSPEKFLFAELIETILLLLKPKWEPNEIFVVSNIPTDTYVVADRQQLQQVLMNIILNAIQAMSTAGKLTISAWQAADTTTISIQDTGCGIDSDDVHKIFEPFYTSKADGVGLGLAISYQLIRENQGTIEVTSTKGEGTRFTIALPTTPHERMN